ncbi:hypothetical protein CHBNII2_03970 [Haemophilus influenzae]|nr:hypothetical protein CHBNII1_00890 [Haemophilus influenzae]BBE81777.1 hypothetical protein CHBNII1_03960 [Haemophilus influenzae]BBE83394.1 hypothetical protein CHBNII2_00890 [Haemophilus influenzae]BBE83702.1 hypothetical protein CHBNII2_03970 [Haemophilus influenzae]
MGRFKGHLNKFYKFLNIKYANHAYSAKRQITTMPDSLIYAPATSNAIGTY